VKGLLKSQIHFRKQIQNKDQQQKGSRKYLKEIGDNGGSSPKQLVKG
jgi:hypothetical protein